MLRRTTTVDCYGWRQLPIVSALYRSSTDTTAERIFLLKDITNRCNTAIIITKIKKQAKRCPQNRYRPNGHRVIEYRICGQKLLHALNEKTITDHGSTIKRKKNMGHHHNDGRKRGKENNRATKETLQL